jgi:hypothetical protein
VDVESNDREIFNVRKYAERAPKYAWSGLFCVLVLILVLILK